MPRTPQPPRTHPSAHPGATPAARGRGLLGALLLAGTVAVTAACTTGTPDDPAAGASGTRTPGATSTPADASPSASPAAPDDGGGPADPGEPAAPVDGGPTDGGAAGGGGTGADGGGTGSGTGGGAPASVPVTLTISGWAGDRAVVSGYAEVVERGGTCRATFSRAGAADVVAEADAVADVATTSCSVEVPGTQLAAGAWTVTLTYASGAHAGAADAATLEVPA